jgi:hypothetical protein
VLLLTTGGGTGAGFVVTVLAATGFMKELDALTSSTYTVAGPEFPWAYTPPNQKDKTSEFRLLPRSESGEDEQTNWPLTQSFIWPKFVMGSLLK